LKENYLEIKKMQDDKLKILIVDDDPHFRLFLFNTLKEWGYDVTAACDGLEAMKILKQQQIELVISDWMMPEIDGIKLCKTIRNLEKENYTYFILVTAKSEKPDFIEGMGAGADDYLTKTFEKDQLEVCIKAGIRILNIQNSLKIKNNKLEITNTDLQKNYKLIEEDLDIASEMQKNLLPKPGRVGKINFQWMFKPASFLAGDIFNYFQLDEDNTVFHIIDVSGHGVPAALLSITLQQLISPFSEDNSPTILNKEKLLNPSEVLHALNQRFFMKNDDQQFFTMVYGVINKRDQTLKISLAGHPLPVMQKFNTITQIGKGSPPIGWIPNPEYENYNISFKTGDRFFLYSDGVTDCLLSETKSFSEWPIDKLIQTSRKWSLEKLMKILWKRSNELDNFEKITDDISFLAFEMN
jgi:sigma-B regulation protein RsbU (phosphoserine phosphatase)